jgi:hypothetical protein
MVFTLTLKNKILLHNWVCDSGASRQYCKLDTALFVVKDINEKIVLGNGESLKATKVGILKCHIVQFDGSSVYATIKEGKYGLDLRNRGLINNFKKTFVSVIFDRVIKIVNRYISGIKMMTDDPSVACITKRSLTSIKEIDVNELNEMIEHFGADRLKKTANVNGLNLKGDFKVCEDCAVSEARQRKLNQDWKGESQVPGERVYLGIKSIKGESYGGSCSWA